MNELRAAVAAFAFLTVLPVPARSNDEADLSRSLAYFPLVGLAIGATLTVAAWVLRDVLPAHLTSIALVTVLVLLTGGLHVDGLADLFDGLGAGRDRGRALSIMQDHRIGAFGATALVLLLATKVGALRELLAMQDTWIVLSFPAIARWAVTLTIVLHPYVRPHGLGTPFTHTSPTRALLATVFIAVLIAAHIGLLVPTLSALVVVFAFGAWLRVRLGGLTGDGYGASIEIGEAAALLGACIGG